MSLQVWLPLNRDLRNQGLDKQVTINGGIIDDNGKLGKCYLVTKTNPITITQSISATSEWTVNFWAKLPSSMNNATAWETMFSFPTINADTGANGISYINWASYHNVKIWDDANHQWFWASPSTHFNYDKWHMWTVAHTANGNGVTGKIYIDGNLIGTYNNTTHQMKIRPGSITIGGGISTGGFYINDFRIYDHCLSQMEVKELSKGLVLHYPLNRGGFGNENLLSRYVVPGQAGPTSTAAGGRTTWLGDYKITIPATENADTYFRLFMSEQLVSGQTYTISCQVDGLLSGSVYRFPMFAQSNTAMGVLVLDHNGLNSLTFTMNWTGTQTAATGANGETVYVNFLDDSSRTIVSGQGAITVSNFKLEKGEKVTPWCPNVLDTLYSTMGLNSLIEYDCSGYCNNSVYNSKPTVSSDTSKYNVSTYFGEYNTPKTDLIDNSLLPALTNCTITWWEKNDTTRTLLLTGQTTSHYIAASDGNTYYHGTVGGTKTLYRDGIAGTYSCEAGKWHHYALVGVDISSWTALHFNSYSSYWYLKGLVSDFRIYATALSADDVKSLYQNR